jgi:NADPH:quinone reductase-like Zn-dependent oxidoreductase
MKVVLWTGYGSPDVLKLGELPKPIPGPKQVLIRNHAVSVTAGDCELRALKLPLWMAVALRVVGGVFRPWRIPVLGMEVAGVVEAIGAQVTGFKPGDAVFGTTGLSFGGYAEYVCLDVEGMGLALTHKPPRLSFAEAACVPLGALEALFFLRRAGLTAGQKVLVIGAGGNIGVYGVQLARHLGAAVTAVDTAPKHAMLRRIGAERTLDHTQTDLAQDGTVYDVIFDVVGKESYRRLRHLLTPSGQYVVASPSMMHRRERGWAKRHTAQTVMVESSDPNGQDLAYLAQLVQAGHLSPVIDRRYRLDQLPEAHRYIESGHKQGSLVVSIIPDALPA